MGIINFKKFLNERVISEGTSRVGILHLQKLTPIKFIQLVKALNKKYGGVLPHESINISEKIDGSSLRFGVNANDRPFIESSYSGEIYDDNGYASYVKSRGYEPNVVSAGFDNILKGVKSDRKLLSVLKKYNNGNGIKIIGEILYVPFGIKRADKIKFIKIAYDKQKIGEEWTFIPFNVIDVNGEEHPSKDEVLKELYKISTSKRSYVPPTIHLNSDIDIRIDINDMNTNLIKKYTDLEDILKSRKKIHRDLKNQLKGEIQEYQTRMANTILSFVKKGVFGDTYEGIVLKLDDDTIVKIVTPDFKNSEFENQLK